MPFKVALLDDDPAICEVFRDNFEAPDIEIWTQIDPVIFLAEVEAFNPDLIFLDFRLPHTSGDRVAGQLDPRIPRAMITGDMEVHPQNHFLRIFYKPYRVPEVEDFIRSFMPRR